ncbi:hypothetical protein ABZ639_26995 [Saccharomonospora sp. NPDC006951]
MAKQTPVLPKAGGGVLVKLVGTVAVIALLVVVVKHPADAAAWVKGVAGTVVDVVDGFVAFFRNMGN